MLRSEAVKPSGTSPYHKGILGDKLWGRSEPLLGFDFYVKCGFTSHIFNCTFTCTIEFGRSIGHENC